MQITKSIVPNLFTLVNLFMGFSAIVAISESDYFKAALFILFAGIFDLLDGLIARWVKSASEFGVELDSLSDAVSFGIAPSFLLYKVYFYQYLETGLLLAALPAITGIIRLARYNVHLTSLAEKSLFTGFPIPAGAFTIISFVLFIFLDQQISEPLRIAGIISVTVLTSLAMISKIKFEPIPRPTLTSIKSKPFVFSFFLIGVIASIVSLGKLIFPFMLVYFFGNTLRHIFLWIKEKREAVDDIDEGEEPEIGPYDV
ncbi:MAG: CDP-diacylglycerol--serine O-phosphatidyltransferase [Candidatus Kapabacteria bacterium]|nr:CDP-diacylglycerol--serine O-phosphatidyltransferase [Candidatus Kapabacteria bacterium]